MFGTDTGPSQRVFKKMSWAFIFFRMFGPFLLLGRIGAIPEGCYALLIQGTTLLGYCVQHWHIHSYKFKKFSKLFDRQPNVSNPSQFNEPFKRLKTCLKAGAARRTPSKSFWNIGLSIQIIFLMFRPFLLLGRICAIPERCCDLLSHGMTLLGIVFSIGTFTELC